MTEAPAAAVPAEYEFDDDPARVDRDAVAEFLMHDAYWGRWRSRDIIESQIDGAWRVVAAYHRPTDLMVGFARAVSDGVAIAYLADVFVDAGHRGRGLGRGLIRTMIEKGAGADFRWLLHTADAHDLYAEFGFGPPDWSCLERPAGARKGIMLDPCR
jgi:GNAT superfamily N-acetyltransferase